MPAGRVAMYAETLSTIATVLAGGSLYLHWRRWRHDQRTKSLIVRIEAKRGDDIPDHWRRLTITFRSRANTGYKAERLRIWWPPSGRVAGWQDCFKQYDTQWGEHRFVEPEKPGGSLNLNLAVAHVSQQPRQQGGGGYAMGTGDTHSQDVFITHRGTGRMLVSIGVTPEDDSERSFTRTKWIRF